MKNIKLYLDAKELIREREFTKALKILKYLNKESPGDSYIEFNIAKIKARDKKTKEEAKEIFEMLTKTHNEHSSSALLELGKIYVSEKKYDKARSAFNKLIKRENDTLAYIELAKLERELRNYETAINLLEYVIKINDQYHDTALLSIVKMERELGNLDKAESWLEKIPKDSAHVEQPWVKFEVAKINIKKGNIEVGINELKNLISTKIKAEVLTELVKVYIKYEQYELADKYNTELQCCLNPKITTNPKQIDTFIKYHLGELEIEDLSKEPYFTQQLCNYSKEKAIEHIATHLEDNEEKQVHSIYSQIIDIEEIYDFATKKIKDIEPEDLLGDKYIIRCNKIIGTTIDNKPTDSLRVVVIPNTNDILTIFPVPAMNNELKIEEVKTKKIERESQIDKFNRKYGKK